MNKKKKILFGVLALLLAFNVWIYFKHFSQKAQMRSVYSAVPPNTAIFVSSPNTDSFLFHLDSLPYLSALKDSNIFVQTLYQQLSTTDSVFSILDSKTGFQQQLLSFHFVGANQLGALYLAENKQLLKIKQIKKIIEKQAFQVKSYKFQHIPILAIQNFKAKKKLYVAVYGNVLLLSYYSPLVEESLQTLIEEKSNQIPKNWHNTTKNIRLFVNHKSKALHTILYSSSFHFTAKDKHWTCYNLHFEPQQIFLKQQYVENKAQETLNPKLINVLPNNTAFFETKAIDKKHLENNAVAFSFFKDWLRKQQTFFCLETFDTNYNKKAGLILPIKNIDTAKVNLYLLNKEMSPVAQFDDLPIYQMNTNTIAELFPHVLFSFQKPYFAFIENNVFFANNTNVLRTCYQRIKQKQTIQPNVNDSIQQYTYFNYNKGKNSLSAIFNLNIFPFNINFVSKTTSIHRNTIDINFEKEIINETTTMWDFVLDTLAQSKAQIVVNPNNQRKEILVQDQKHTVYIVNQSGNLVLKKPFQQKIMSNVYQIDLYKTNQLLYVFNTKTHIYALHRSGKIANGFPIKLPTQASNSLLVVNYDNAKKYRFFIACENEKVYGYEANGKPLKAWSPLGSFGLVTQQIQHKVFNGKDYIYFHNKQGKFFAFNRKGEQRFMPVPLDAPFAQAFATSTKGFLNLSKGTLFTLDLKGKPQAKILADSTYIHFAYYAEKNAYAIASKNQFSVRKSQWNILGEKTLNDEIVSIEKIKWKQKLWFLVNGKHSIYLINELGEIHRDFPMLASSEARITHFHSKENPVLLFIENQKLKAFALGFVD